MAEKFAIYAGEPLARVLAGHEHERSARVNQIAADWLAMTNGQAPALTVACWQALLDALNSTALTDQATLRLCWAAVADADGLGDKWGIDQAALAERLRGLSLPQLIALREVLDGAWNLMGGHELLDALRLAGARIGG